MLPLVLNLITFILAGIVLGVAIARQREVKRLQALVAELNSAQELFAAQLTELETTTRELTEDNSVTADDASTASRSLSGQGRRMLHSKAGSVPDLDQHEDIYSELDSNSLRAMTLENIPAPEDPFFSRKIARVLQLVSEGKAHFLLSELDALHQDFAQDRLLYSLRELDSHPRLAENAWAEDDYLQRTCHT